MLTLTFARKDKDGKKYGENNFNWHVGEAKPRLHSRESDNLLYVQADGDELLHIMLIFKEIPMTSLPIVKWRQPWASFIVDNL
jgi:hypothetical protein